MKHIIILIILVVLCDHCSAQQLTVSFGSPITFQPIAKDSSLHLTAALGVYGPGKTSCTVRLHPSADISVGTGPIALYAGTSYVSFTFHPSSAGCYLPPESGISLEAISNAAVVNPLYVIGYVYEGASPIATAIPAQDTLHFPVTIAGSTSTQPLALGYEGDGKPRIITNQLHSPFAISSYPTYLGPCPFQNLQVAFHPALPGVYKDTLRFYQADSITVNKIVLLEGSSEAADVASRPEDEFKLFVHWRELEVTATDGHSVTAEAYDVLGRIRKASGLSSATLTNLESGIYFVHMRSEHHERTVKILIP